jgi:dihydrofolate reductase
MSAATATHQHATTGRRVVVTEFVTLDGFMVGPDEDMSWVAVGFDPQMQDDIAVAMNTGIDVFAFGRVTYEIFAAYWPHAVPYDEGDDLAPAEGKEDPRIIDALNRTPKLVFSTTLAEPPWMGTRVVADLEDEVRRLRSEPGGIVAVQGSASVVATLARADLVDQYHLYVHPVLLGAGTPLFPVAPARHDLVLTQLKRYANGVLATTYDRRRDA